MMNRQATRHDSAGTSKAAKKIRYAVVGLGYISQVAVLPGFANATANSTLSALVSDDPEKLKKLGRKYKVKHLTDYDGYQTLLESGEIDAVYIALPNHMHAQYTMQAATAGIHVLCEKPMEVTEAKCQEMIDACHSHDVRLMIAYRLHFEPMNLKAVEIARSGKLGELRLFNSTFTMQVQDEGNIRLNAAKGGGPLYDIGIYCLNAARYLFEAEPMEIMAMAASNDEHRFKEVDEMTSVQMRFPGNRLASFICSFGSSDVGHYVLAGSKGSLFMDTAYSFANTMKYKLTIDGKTKEHESPKHDQFGPELIYFSNCILNHQNPEPGGQEGLADVSIIRAMLQSIDSGQPVKIKPTKGVTYPMPEQKIRKPLGKKPKLIHANAPDEKR